MRATFAGLTHAIRNLMMAVFAIICHPYFLRTASNGAPLGLYCPFKALEGRQFTAGGKRVKRVQPPVTKK